MFNLANVLTILKDYCLQVENIDQLITMVKIGQMIYAWIAWQMQTSRIILKLKLH
jgi:hypothetical protein